MYDVVKADEMKIFSTASNFFISAYRCMSVNTNGFRVDTVFQKHGKHFQETENEYAHKLMEDLPFYSNSLCIHPVQQDKLILHHEKSYENLNAIERFINITIKNLSEGLNIENEKFTNIVQELCATLHEVSNEEIKNILHYLSMWPPAPSTRSQNFKILWNMLDKECVKRLKQWNHICGEVYKLDDIMLSKFDELECHPEYYTRLTEEVQMITEDKDIIKPWIYFLKNFRPELLNLPFMSNYSSKGPHGLEYVSRYKRNSKENYYSDVMNL